MEVEIEMFEVVGEQLKRNGNGPAVHVFSLRSGARANLSRRVPSMELSLQQHVSAKKVRNVAVMSPGFGQTNPGNEN
jgi:hypothetical protein